ncbi:unnamed protein product [Blepharisma stoltei]|uniref:Receptor ligand binding region domain-containing protein n=1 Tax=Blepharisma stoltei TaxID=1481888 RepID=A0AAU9JH55_9CILI|nr:unnamed protein product [Blepharisma stoltei]
MMVAFSLQFFCAHLLIFILFIKLCNPLEVVLARFESSKSSLNALNDASIKEIYQSFSSIEWHECNISVLTNCILAYPKSSILLDISKVVDIQFKISKICSELSLVHLVYQDKFYYEDEWTFSLIPQKNKQLDALLALLSYFNWAQGIFICDQGKSEWREKILGFSSEFEWLTVESESSIEDLVNGVIFQLGSTLYYILTGTSKSTQILNSLSDKKLLDTGNGIVFLQEGGYRCNYEGALIITEVGQELALSIEEYFKNSAIRVIDILIRNEFSDFKKLLNSNLNDYHNKSRLSIVNIQDGLRKTVGSIQNGNVTIFGDLIFPGHSNSTPKSIKKILQLSISAGTTNPGTPAIPNAAVYQIERLTPSHNSFCMRKFRFFGYYC